MSDYPWSPKTPEAEQFYLQYGKTLSAWAEIERSLNFIFCGLCGFTPLIGIGPKLFFSGRSFQTRIDLLSAALDAARKDLPARPLINQLIKRARQYSATRNRVAHGLPNLSSDRAIDHVVQEGRDFALPGGITLPELRRAQANFQAFNEIIWEIRFLPDNPELPAKLLQRILELPNEPHSTEEDLNA